jgi:hypothetical protein
MAAKAFKTAATLAQAAVPSSDVGAYYTEANQYPLDALTGTTGALPSRTPQLV